MPPALEPGANFVFPNLMLGSTKTFSVMVHQKPSILHLHETAVRERGKIQLHTCFVLLYHTFNYLMCSPLNSEMNVNLVYHYACLVLQYSLK